MRFQRRDFLAAAGLLTTGTAGCLRLSGTDATSTDTRSPTESPTATPSPDPTATDSPTSEPTGTDSPTETPGLRVLDPVWTYEADGGFPTAAVMRDGTLYATSENGVVHRLTTTGERGVNFVTTAGFEAGIGAGPGGLFVGTDGGRLIRLGPDKGSRWSRSVGSAVEDPPRVTEDTVYVPTAHDGVVALATDDPTELWRFDPGSPSTANMVPEVGGGRVYVGLYTHGVYGLSPETGEQDWSYQTDDSILSSPRYHDGMVFIGSDDETLYALDAATGDLQWQFETDTAIWTRPAVVDDTVVFGNNAGYLIGLSRESGTEQWRVPGKGSLKADPLVDDGIIYAVNDSGQFGAFDPATGEFQWGVALETEVTAAPTVLSSEGLVIVASTEGRLYALETEQSQ